MIIHGLGELATVSAMFFLRTFHHLSVTDPASSVLADLRHRYNKIFPFRPEFGGLPFYSTMAKIYDSVNHNVQWVTIYYPPGDTLRLRGTWLRPPG